MQLNYKSPRPKLIIMQGISGSGKSTWAKKYVKDNPDFRTISRDEIRKELLGSNDIERYFENGMNYSIEEEVSKLEEKQLAKTIKSGKFAIIDNTNLKLKYVAKYVRTALDCGLVKPDIEFHVMESILPYKAKERVDSRGERKVSQEVIEAQYKSMEGAANWTREDVFDAADKLPSKKWFFPPFEVDSTDIDKGEKAIICDLDGTLAHRRLLKFPLPHYRSFYDYGECCTDIVDPVVLCMLEGFVNVGYKIIFVTGRKDDCLEETRDFIDKYFKDNYILFSREVAIDFHDGKDDSDDIVKYRIFNDHIRGKYKVEAVIDDRKRVLAMWEALGIKVINVGSLNEEF